MNENQVIEMLIKQNERLMAIIEKFADKDQKIINDIKVNSYNGSSATSEAECAPKDVEIGNYVSDSQNVKQTIQ